MFQMDPSLFLSLLPPISMSSKIIGAENEFFSNLCYDAVNAVKFESIYSGKVEYDITAINVLKCHGKSSLESELVDGFALNCVKGADGELPKSGIHTNEYTLSLNQISC
jgi:chaperonin GroEL (HSP60 family)